MKPSRLKSKATDICIVGGAGHVGLPLALVFAARKQRVLIYDINEKVLGTIRSGEVPFMESGAEDYLKTALKEDRLDLTSDPSRIREASTVVITIGTPVDEFLNPDTKVMRTCMDRLLPYLRDGQLIVLRSTVYPGTTEWLDHYLKDRGKKVHLAFCPERVVQGYAIEEVQRLPQIVSGMTPKAAALASALFRKIAPEVVALAPLEAEFAKLFSNSYRYIQFAASNQFYMIANSAGVDYDRVLAGMKKNYGRLRDLPKAGLAAGPCLLKDTMQLAAFSDNQFSLGHSAMTINEGLVLYLVGQMEKRFDLKKSTVGILGMAFKANSDDARASLSYKLKKVLQFHAKEVLTTDPHVNTDKDLLPVQEVIRRSDVLVLCVPHDAYKGLKTGKKPVIDIWNFFGRGIRI